MTHKWEVILELGGAGGKITLLGKMVGYGKWIFKLKTDESALADFIDREERNLLNAETNSVEGWEGAFKLLNRYPWIKLRPRKVHPLFKPILRDKLENDDEFFDCHYSWLMLCSENGDHE